MTNSQLQEYARFGAEARLHAIEEERDAIMRAFPDLGRSSGRTNGASPLTARGQGMSPSQRKAVGERMKAYWAKRRAEKVRRVDSNALSASEASPAAAKQPSRRKSGMSAEARRAQGERMRAYWAARRAQKQAGSAKRAGRKTGGKK
jgi:hypothetical protein